MLIKIEMLIIYELAWSEKNSTGFHFLKHLYQEQYHFSPDSRHF